MSGIWRDATSALGALRRSPLLTVTIVLILAVAIGATTATYSVLDGVLLRPLPVRDADRVLLIQKRTASDAEPVPFQVADLAAYRARTRAFSDVGGVSYDGAWPYPFRDGDRPVTIVGTGVSGEFFEVLGMRPALGRLLRSDDGATGARPVAVISHAAWQRLFGGDTTVVGRRLIGFTGSIEIVGVAAAGFEYPRGVEIWLPLQATAEQIAQRSYGPYSLVARLRSGVSIEQGATEVTEFLRRQEADAYRPGESTGHVVDAAPLREAIVGDVRPTLWALFAAVGLVLVLAVVNVSGLLLVRAADRRRELAVRAALGASRGRILRALLVESSLLATAGAILGVLLAVWTVVGLLALAPADLPAVDQIKVNGRVLAFATLVLLVATALVGLAPALWAARADLHAGLRGGSRVSVDSRRIQHAKEMLIASQIAIAVVVLAGAGLLAKSLLRLRQVDLGFAASELTVAQIPLLGSAYRDAERRLTFLEQLTERLEAVQGIDGATPVLMTPFAGAAGWTAFITIEGQDAAQAAANPSLDLQSVLPNYFRTMGVPLQRGRIFTAEDRDGSAPVAIVSEMLANRAWPGGDPIGKRLKFGGADSPSPWHTVVGVVADTRYRDLTVRWPALYIPRRQLNPATVYLAVRSAMPLSAVSASVRAAVSDLDSSERVYDVATMEQYIHTQLAQPRFVAAVIAGFSAISLLLATVGLYGLVASFVRRRVHEIGIRRALGAQSWHIRRVVLGSGLRTVLTGIATGVALALAATRGLTALLFDVEPTDPVTLAGAGVLLLVAAAFAAYIPLRRATGVDPIIALRSE